MNKQVQLCIHMYVRVCMCVCVDERVEGIQISVCLDLTSSKTWRGRFGAVVLK